MLEFTINESNFFTLFGAYLTFFAVIYAISKGINTLFNKG